ncbi:MAG: epoxyqueuosine reductase, partial [Desulfuromonadales bacterium]|nr:epoxyqueuosine reductase [Desulfuromonadales bacterium]
MNKESIREKAYELGAELVGFAPVSRWHESEVIPENYHPDQVWHKTRTVISLALPVWLPIVETQPSAWGRDQYGIVNNLLDEIAYRLAAFLNRNGIASINVGRDGYGDIDALIRKPSAAFSHVWAAHFAGIGKVGWNHTLLTRSHGPRVRLVSVLSSIEVEGDPLVAEDLCLRCFLCRDICPVDAFSGKNDLHATMDPVTCATNSKRLR